MKNIANHLLPVSAVLASMMSLGACDEIALEDRLVYVEPAAVSRAVLIEDFTGQRCINCPKATDVIHEMQEVYGADNIIAVAIHSGPFGYAGNSKNVGLMTDLGKEYWSTWFTDDQGQPVGKINRGPATEDYVNWGAEVSRQMAKPSSVSLDCTLTYDAESRAMDIHTETLAPAGTKARLQLWLIEDGIVAIQMQPDGSTDREYVHNHVLREAINGSWGEEITCAEGALSLDHHYTLPEKYVAGNCAVVAFVYNDEGVLQVVRKGI